MNKPTARRVSVEKFGHMKDGEEVITHTLVHLIFNSPVGDWKPVPFPGSGEGGCICPEKQPWPQGMTLNSACPAHQLEKGE